MSEYDQDQRLAALFAESDSVVADDVFVSRVMDRVGRRARIEAITAALPHVGLWIGGAAAAWCVLPPLIKVIAAVEGHAAVLATSPVGLGLAVVVTIWAVTGRLPFPRLT